MTGAAATTMGSMVTQEIAQAIIQCWMYRTMLGSG